jgi:hypothetical protein
MDPRFPLPSPSSSGRSRGHHRRAHPETFLHFPDAALLLNPDGDFSFSNLDFPSLPDDSPAISDPWMGSPHRSKVSRRCPVAWRTTLRRPCPWTGSPSSGSSAAPPITCGDLVHSSTSRFEIATTEAATATAMGDKRGCLEPTNSDSSPSFRAAPIYRAAKLSSWRKRSLKNRGPFLRNRCSPNHIKD